MSGRGSSRGGSALPRSSVCPGFGGGVRPGTLTLNLRPSLVVSSLGFGSSGSPGIGLTGLSLLLGHRPVADASGVPGEHAYLVGDAVDQPAVAADRDSALGG